MKVVYMYIVLLEDIEKVFMHWIVLLLLLPESARSNSKGVRPFAKRDDAATHGQRVSYRRPFRDKRLKIFVWKRFETLAQVT